MQTAIYVHTDASDAIDSCDVQEQVCRDLCERYGYDESVRVYRNEACKDDTCSGLTALLDAVQQGKIQQLVVDSYRRLSCGMQTLEDTLHTLDLHNVAIVAVDDNSMYADPVSSRELFLEDTVPLFAREVLAVPSMRWDFLPTRHQLINVSTEQQGEPTEIDSPQAQDTHEIVSNQLIMHGVFPIAFAYLFNVIEWFLTHWSEAVITCEPITQKARSGSYMIRSASSGDLAEIHLTQIGAQLTTCAILDPSNMSLQHLHRIRSAQIAVCDMLQDEVPVAVKRMKARTNPTGPHDETDELFVKIRNLKDKNPSLTYLQISQEIRQQPGYEYVDENKVRYAVKTVAPRYAWKWKRGSRRS